MKNKTEIKRIGGYLHKIVQITDEKGNIVDRLIAPIMVELKPRDIAQIMAGAIVLAIPVCLTEECWTLAGTLSTIRTLLLLVGSMLVMGLYVYFNFYRNFLKDHVGEFIKRVIAIYVISGLVVATFLSLIGKFPIVDMPGIALKRVVIALLPCSMGATIVDSMK